MTVHRRSTPLMGAQQHPPSYVELQLCSMQDWANQLKDILDFIVVTPHDHDGGAIAVATEIIKAEV